MQEVRNCVRRAEELARQFAAARARLNGRTDTSADERDEVQHLNATLWGQIEIALSLTRDHDRASLFVDWIHGTPDPHWPAGRRYQWADARDAAGRTFAESMIAKIRDAWPEVDFADAD